jgi:hypothetical protein
VSGFTNRPTSEEAWIAHGALEAILREFAGNTLGTGQVPRFVVTAEIPPDGRVGVASTGDGAVDTLRMAVLALGAAKSGVRAAGIDPDELMAAWAEEFRRTGTVAPR